MNARKQTGETTSLDTTNLGLSIWNKVEKTDPQYTTPMSGGFKGTAISPAYMIKRATEMFGPIGLGWGYEIVEDGFHDGSPMGFNAQGDALGPQRVHILRLKFWYMHQGQKGEFEHYGQTPFVGLNFDRDRVVTDGDVKKKSLTDALTKCLSMLGICSDVHLGLHDDNKYVAGLITEFADAPAPQTSTTSRRKNTAPQTAAAPASSPAAVTTTPSAEGPTASNLSQADQVQTSSQQPGQAGLELDTPAPTPAASVNDSPVQAGSSPQPDLTQWLRRIKSLGADAIGISKTTVKSIFSGEDLARVQQALEERESELNS